jgi:hypothetical protein
MDMTLSITIPCLLLTVLPLSNEVIKIRPIMSDMSQSPSRDPSHFGRCSYPFPKFVSASQHFGPFSYPLPKSASASQHFAPFNYPPPKFASAMQLFGPFSYPPPTFTCMVLSCPSSKELPLPPPGLSGPPKCCLMPILLWRAFLSV